MLHLEVAKSILNLSVVYHAIDTYNLALVEMKRAISINNFLNKFL